MHLVTYEVGGNRAVGVRIDGALFDSGYADMVSLIEAGAAGLERAQATASSGSPVEGYRLLAPVPAPGKLLYMGINYASHKEENPEAVMPVVPVFFSKLPNGVIGPGEPIVIPAEDTFTDYEVEVAVVIGKRAKNVTRDEALDFVFGYTVANDVSARDVQTTHNQLTLGKGPDTFAPLGPVIVTSDEIPDPSKLHVSTRVNGATLQSAPTSEWLFDVPFLIEYASRYVTFNPGDILSTGTPAGVGFLRDPQISLQPGDEVTVEVDAIGELTNPVVAGW